MPIARNDTAPPRQYQHGPKQFDLSKYDEEVQGIVRVVAGTNPEEPLEKFRLAQEQVGRLREDMAVLKARHWGNAGSPSHFDLERKQLLSKLAESERTRRVAQGGKPPSDTELDKFAHAHPDYNKFLVEGRAERLDLERLQARLDAMLGAASYYDKTCRISEEMIRVMRTERGNTY